MSDPTLIAPAPSALPVTLAEVAAAPTVAPSAPVAAAPPAAGADTAAPVVEATPVPAEPQTLLGTVTADAPVTETTTPDPNAPKTEEVKPADGAEPNKPLDGDVKPEQIAEEGSKSDEPAPLPTYDAFALPEGITLDTDGIGKFTNILGEFEATTKADHAAVQAHGQKLLDMHVAEVQQAVERVGETYRTLWDKQKVDWKDDFLKDPELGGNRQQTTIDAANKFIRMHGGSEAEQTELRNLLEQSGLGNHKAVIRTFAKAGAAMSEGKPLAASKPPPKVTSNVDKMYGGRSR